jgi:quinolinate synthase
MAVWDPHALPEENFAAGCDHARIVLWKGHCSVHVKFLPAHVDAVRARIPGVQVMAHPECPFEVVRKCDRSGSTEQIIAALDAAPAGSAWAIGTEFNLVSRLARSHPDKTVVSLSGINCLCSTMYRIDAPHLMRCLEGLLEGRLLHRVSVDPATASEAILALDRMLALP